MSGAASDTILSPVVDLSRSVSVRPRGRWPRDPSPVDTVRAALGEAATREETHLVVVSSALVYGAWENSAVPLDETSTVRPRQEIPDAVALASAEAMVEQWRRGAPGRTVTVLRPVTVVTAGGANPMVRALARAVALTRSQAPAPAQFLDRGDLEAAIELCRRVRPDAVLNVAPPGMIHGERLRELVPAVVDVPLPGAVAESIESWRTALEVGPGALAHVRHPWVVSADRLRALGWEARVSNEEAFVAGTTEGWFGSLSAKRRQELALAAAGALALVSAVAGVSLWRRATRR
jgi:nucleoside-diphosphate-sugar epimerase